MSDLHYEPDDRTDAVADAYLSSDRIRQDAIDHLATAEHVPAWLAAEIQQWYWATDACATMIEDIAAGEVEL